MLLSVIVIAKNEQFIIDKCIKSIIINGRRDLSGNSFEVIVVDSDSSDCTLDISIDTFKKCNFNNWSYIKYKSKVLTAALGREIGRKYASGDFLLFLDGDMLLFKDFLKVIFQSNIWDNNTVGIVGSRLEGNFSNDTIKSIEKFKRRFYKDKYVLDLGGAVLLKNELVKEVNYNIGQIYCEEEVFTKKLASENKFVKYFDNPMFIHMDYKKRRRDIIYKFNRVCVSCKDLAMGIRLHIKRYGFFSGIKYYKSDLLESAFLNLVMFTYLYLQICIISPLVLIVFVIGILTYFKKRKLAGIRRWLLILEVLNFFHKYKEQRYIEVMKINLDKTVSL